MSPLNTFLSHKSLNRMILSSKGPARRLESHFAGGRFLSSEASIDRHDDFKSEKVRDLFQRITEKLSKEDVYKLSASVNNILGREFRPNEFYHRGVGGARAAPSGQASAIDPAEDTGPKTVDLKLSSFDAKAKIKVIKEVRAMAGLGLKESKELVEGAPSIVQKGLKPEQAEELKAQLEAVGAVVELV